MGGHPWQLLFLALLGVSRSQENIIGTTTGSLRGISVSTTVGPARAFFGVPYAEPPMGAARFKKPQLKKPWKGVYNATSLPPLCPQRPLHFNEYYMTKETDPMSEDCLFLNVFTPEKPSPTLRPVVVYIHGGFFSYGGLSMKLHDASELAAREDLVVIILAYRLTVFGFLNMGVEDAPGNMGLYDQLMALHWIRSNVKAFGGDPDQVTIMGQSAGSFSVGVHLTSPKSKGLFRRAIMQSGSPFTSTLSNTKEQASHRARVLAKTLDCHSQADDENRPELTVKCLRSKSVEAILNATASFTTEGLDGFFSVVGDELIPVSPAVALKNGKVNAHELLIGISESEGDGLMHFIASRIRDADDAADVAKSSMIFFAKGVMLTVLDLDSKPVIDHYFGSSVHDGTEAVQAAADLIGDNQIGCPTLGFATRFSRPGTTTYMYQLSQQPSKIGWPKWVRPTHADEIAFVLGSIFKFERDISPSEAKATENLMRIISTFSRTGVPQVSDGTPWPRFDEEKRYMDIRKEGNFPQKLLLKSVCDLWEKVRPYE